MTELKKRLVKAKVMKMAVLAIFKTHTWRLSRLWCTILQAVTNGIVLVCMLMSVGGICWIIQIIGSIWTRVQSDFSMFSEEMFYSTLDSKMWSHFSKMLNRYSFPTVGGNWFDCP